MAADGLELGSIGRPHGVHGEVTVMLRTDRPERTAPGAVLYANDRELVVESARRGRIVTMSDVLST